MAFQPTIDEFFLPIRLARESPPPTPRRGLLDLPQQIRRRIYLELGLGLPGADDLSLLSLNRNSTVAPSCFVEPELYPRRTHWCQDCSPLYPTYPCKPVWCTPEKDCDCDLSLPTALFYVCRQISAEARTILYGENKLLVVYNEWERLSALRRLTPVAISALRHLTVRLNLCFCPSHAECTDPAHNSFLQCHACCKLPGHDDPVPAERAKRTKEHNLMAAQWRYACQHLGKYLTTGRLSLTFSCDTRDFTFAQEITSPLRELGRLRSCSISLLRTYDAQLARLADMCALRAMGYPKSRYTAPFRFRALPKELQLQILEHTDLLPPPDPLWYIRMGPKFVVEASVQHDCSYTAASLWDETCFCCCRGGRRHSSASPSCTHWHLPFSLLLVDKAMKADAEEILYREKAWLPVKAPDRSDAAAP